MPFLLSHSAVRDARMSSLAICHKSGANVALAAFLLTLLRFDTATRAVRTSTPLLSEAASAERRQTPTRVSRFQPAKRGQVSLLRPPRPRLWPPRARSPKAVRAAFRRRAFGRVRTLRVPKPIDRRKRLSLDVVSAKTKRPFHLVGQPSRDGRRRATPSRGARAGVVLCSSARICASRWNLRLLLPIVRALGVRGERGAFSCRSPPPGRCRSETTLLSPAPPPSQRCIFCKRALGRISARSRLFN